MACLWLLFEMAESVLPPMPAVPAERGELRDGFRFRADRLCLDLCATVGKRASASPVELLATPVDLARWLRVAGLATGEAPPISERELADARALREALYRLAQATINGAADGAATIEADRALVNRWAARQGLAPQLTPAVPESAALGMSWTHGSARACLATIAQDGVMLLAGPLAERVRRCAACTILFVDLSRGGTRRWCSMAACGNRAKVTAFRQRATERTRPE
jgi:predicted RNA-binding Zn ribbon-like protein